MRPREEEGRDEPQTLRAIYEDALLDIRIADGMWGRRTRLPRLRAAFTTLGTLARIATCAVRGHRLEDLDPGDPEVGPQPDVVCVRCHRY